MSLGSSNNYWTRAGKVSAQETWLVRLYYDTESSYIGISDRDITVSSVFYAGVVVNFGAISEQIRLSQSEASIGNVTIQCRNLWKNESFAKELVHGSRDYINRKVDIFSRRGDTTTASDCEQIFQGRLYNVTQQRGLITLEIEEKKPEDYIQIPNSRNDDNVLIPIVYGDYTQNDSVSGSEDFVDDKALFPAPVLAVRSDDFIGHVQESITSPAEANAHYYERSIDGFVQIEDPTNTTSESYKGSNVILADIQLQRTFRFRPNATMDSGANAFTDEDKAYDGTIGSSNYALADISHTGTGTTFRQLKLKIPNIPGGTFSDLNVRLHYELDIDSVNEVVDVGAKLEDTSYGLSAPEAYEVFDEDTAGVTGGVGSPVEWAWDTADRYNNNNQLPEFLRLTFTLYGNDASDDIVAALKIFEVDIYGTIELDFSTADNYVRSLEFINNIDTLYCGADGLSKSYTGGSGTATLPHEIHRDLLARHANFDYADANMTNWSALNTARSGWDARGWLLEPTLLEEVLQRLQYEGGFIFKVYPDGGKYIYVKDSYSSSDVVHTITEDDVSEGVNVSLSPFSDVVTKTVYEYQRHPATDGHVASRTYTNSSARSTWWPSIGSTENEKTQRLDWLVDDPYDSGSDSNPNDCIGLYYDNIIAEPKITVSCTIVNKAMQNLEVGDIIKFNLSYMDVNFGKSTTVYFMVTSTRRTTATLSITAREVYDA